MNKPLILASNSPRRHELLAQAGIEHRILTAPADEGSVSYTPRRPENYVISLAELKNDAVASLTGIQVPENALILSADTVVYDPDTDTVLGKPKNRENAIRMLSSLSGKSHCVITGVCITDSENGHRISFAVTTEVFFRSLTHGEIADYVDTAKPYDKAGAYGIQERACLFVEKIVGDYCNVVGLPVSEVWHRLKEFSHEYHPNNTYKQR